MEKPVLPPSFWRELARDNPWGRRDITESDAKAWFDWVWPAYREHRPSARPKHRMRISRWWIRATPADLDRARVKRDGVYVAAESERVAKKAQDAFGNPSLLKPVYLPPLRVGRGSERG